MLTSFGTGYRGGESQVIAVPDRGYRPNNSRRGVLLASGAGGLAIAEITPPFTKIPAALTQGGYPCLACDFGNLAGYNFGNDDAITAGGAAYTYLSSAPVGAKTDKILCWGGSMGALTCLNWARQNLSSVLAVGLAIPALDLNDVYVHNKGGFQASIGTAYGVAYPTALPGLATHSPAAYGSSDLAGLHIIAFGSDNDPIATPTASIAGILQAAGATVTVVSLGNVGHDASTVDPYALVRFFDTNGGRS